MDAARRLGRVAAGLLLIGVAGCSSLRSGRTAEALPNFQQVNGSLYRGGQPTPEGLRQLARLGIKTVIDLRSEGSAVRLHEQQMVQALGMGWVSLPMRAFWRPSDRQVLDFLRLALDPRRQPLFVHCRRGRDRVGVLVAAYHVAVEGWDPRRAYADARARGMTRWNPLLRDVILREAQHEYAPAAAAIQTQTAHGASVQSGG